jgi:hypothetical protein
VLKGKFYSLKSPWNAVIVFQKAISTSSCLLLNI